ncbi:hypothetical protein Taro_027997 [Colocasia esculenta]|uniref:Uncharacterized protein n=1 Tax=Colocasia esculenta TaxID=4460 RepID=A0A843VQI5_COLES|nr:hypothetical protein [Colocasia esculenta]
MNGLAKLRRKKTPAMRIDAKPKTAVSRNPLRELSNGRLQPAHSRKGVKGGCFGFLLTNSSSSSSVSSTASSSSRGVLPRSPKSAPLCSRAPRPLDARGGPAGVRSRASLKDVSGGARPRFRSLKQSRTDEQQKPTSRSILPRRNRGRAGSEECALQKKDAVEGGRCAAAGDTKGSAFEAASEDGNGATSLRSTPGRGAIPAHFAEVCLGFNLVECGDQLSHGSVLVAAPGKEGGQQPSHSPASTKTATPPVQASISPELGTQSALPTPACFAAGHLVAGVQDRRKCRPRGFLTGGNCGVEIADGGCLGSSGASGSGSGSRRVSLTPPPPLEASVHWLSPPCDDSSGRLRPSAVSSSSKKAPLGVSPAEASVHWFLSPLADATDACVLEDFPSAASEPTGDSPEFGSLLGMSSSPFEKTPSGVEICCSPTANSSVSPFSLIIQKATASARGRNHSLRGKGRRHRYGSVVNNSLFSGDSDGGSNVICTPSTCSCSSRQVGSFPAFDLQDMGEAVETLNPSSPLWKLLSSETQELLSFSPPKSGDPSTPSNSISLSCFRRPSWHRKSVKDGSHAREERSSSSEMKVSWREGLISRMFEMDEFDQTVWTSDKENVGSHGEDELSLQPDIKLVQILGRSSMIKDVNEQFATDGYGSFEFVGNKQNGEKGEVKVSSPIPIPCAESLRMDMDALASSDDSDWNLFFKNNLFEV